MTELDLPTLAKRSFDLFVAHPLTFLILASPLVLESLNYSIWSPAVDLPLSLGSTVLSQIVVAAIIYAAATAHWGETPKIGESYQATIRRIGPLLEFLARYLGSVILLSITVVGLPFAVRTLVRWIFGVQEVVLKDATAKTAISQSCKLVEGRWWQLAAVALLTIIPSTLPSIITWILLDTSSLAVIGVSIGIDLLIVPFVNIFWTLLFFQLRDRQEPTVVMRGDLQPA